MALYIYNVLAVLVGVVVVGVSSNTKVLKVLPDDSKVLSPKPRIKIPSDFAKNYWISGTFFNSANFQGMPMSFYFTGPKCVNFPSLQKSLKPFGCVMLYKEKNCGGTYVMADDDMADLSESGLGEVKSMRTCPPVDDSWRQSADTTAENDKEEGQDSLPLYKTVDAAVDKSQS